MLIWANKDACLQFPVFESCKTSTFVFIKSFTLAKCVGFTQWWYPSVCQFVYSSVACEIYYVIHYMAAPAGERRIIVSTPIHSFMFYALHFSVFSQFFVCMLQTKFDFIWFVFGNCVYVCYSQGFGDLRTVDVILTCLEYPDFTVSRICFFSGLRCLRSLFVEYVDIIFVSLVSAATLTPDIDVAVLSVSPSVCLSVTFWYSIWTG